MPEASYEEISLAGPFPTIRGLAFPGRESRKALAVHGWMDNAASFLQLAPYLKDCQLTAIDLPGHGHSDHLPEHVNYHFYDFVHFAACALNAAWVGEPGILVGHSMGAGIASLVAASFPEKVRALVLIEGLCPLSAPPEEAPSRLRLHLEQRGTPASGKVRFYKSLEEAVRVRELATPMDRAGARHIVERNCIEVAGKGFKWRSDRRLKLPSALRITEDQAIAYLSAIRCPTLVLRADRGYPFPHFKRFASHIGDLTFKDLRGGHHLHCDDPTAVANEINGWLRKVAE